MKAVIELGTLEINEILREWCKAKGISQVKSVSMNCKMHYEDRPGNMGSPQFEKAIIEVEL